LYLRYEETILKNKFLNKSLLALYFIIISLHGYGTHERNKIWSSSSSLWYDATVKSPNNGRAQMNYGLTLMAAGKYDETLPYFQRALELMPHWAYIHINMGVLRNAMGYPQEAEQYFKNAIRYQPFVPDAYFFYAHWLQSKGRVDDAITQLEEGYKISPGHAGITSYLNELKSQTHETKEEKIAKLEKLTHENPTADNYINLSLEYYKNGMYKECVMVCEKALELQPHLAAAYNNICSAYNSMGEWKKASIACSKALEIDSTFQLAKNNLAWAKGNLPK
jgi:tetratricopeptide (TPR) repeat protein